MLAYFSQETVLPPLGLVSASFKAHGPKNPQFELQDLEGEEVKEEMFDLGLGNAMRWRSGSRCNYSQKGCISCLFAGHQQQWPVVDQLTQAAQSFLPEGNKRLPDSAASWLLELLNASEGEQLSSEGTLPFPTLDTIGRLQGPFAFVVYDSANQRVLAARDKGGEEELFWGVTADGQLQFSSSVQALESCSPTATAFPAGSVFVSATTSRASQPGSLGWTIGSHKAPGTLQSFVKSSTKPPKANTKVTQPSFKTVKAVPRINSQGCLCGAVYRVVSDQNLAYMTATH